MNSIRWIPIAIFFPLLCAMDFKPENVKYLSEQGYNDLLTRSENFPNKTTLLYVHRVKTSPDRKFIDKTLDMLSRMHSRFKRFDLDVEIFAVNCKGEMLAPLCDNANDDFHFLKVYHNRRVFEKELKSTVKISERNLIKEILKFINPDYIDGCEDVTLNTIVSEDPLLQDDEEEVTWYTRRKDCFHCPLDFKNVKLLCPKTVQSFFDSNTFSMVLFYLNIDAKSRPVVEKFITASTLRKDHAMGAVACSDWPEICDKFNIDSWPQIWFFKNQQTYKRYEMPFDSSLIADSLDLISIPTATLLESAETIDHFIQGHGVQVSSGKQIPALTVGFFSSPSDKEYSVFSSVAELLRGSYVFGSAFGQVAEDWLKSKNAASADITFPTMVTVKPAETISSVAFFADSSFDPHKIISFVKKSSSPSVKELNLRTLPSLMSSHGLLVIAVLPNGKDHAVYQTLNTLAQKTNLKDVHFAYVDQSKELVTTCKILKAYHLSASETPIFIGKTVDSVYFYQQNNEEQEFNIENLSRWIFDITNKNIQPTIMLQKFETTERPLAFDYMDLQYENLIDKNGVTEKLTTTMETGQDGNMEWSNKKMEKVIDTKSTTNGHSEL